MRLPALAALCIAIVSPALAAPTPPGTTYARGRIVIPGVDNAVTIAAGSFHIVVLDANGNAIPWGDNAAHQIDYLYGESTHIAAGRLHSLSASGEGFFIGGWGDDSFEQITIPPATQHKEVLDLDAGRAHSIAVFVDHTVIAWGDDTFDQNDVPPDLPDVTAIAAGDDHNLALLTDQTVVAWGDNRAGQCDVPANLQNVTAVAAGAKHSLAMFSVGGGAQPNVVAWGDNSQGQSDVPTEVVLAEKIAAGAFHSLALLSDGSVICWGANNDGQCDVPDNLSGVAEIAAGERASYAILTDGSIVAWGLVPFACEGDLNGDNTTNVLDFGDLLASFGMSGATRAQGDLNDDGTVDVFDFGILAADFGCLIEGDDR